MRNTMMMCFEDRELSKEDIIWSFFQCSTEICVRTIFSNQTVILGLGKHNTAYKNTTTPHPQQPIPWQARCSIFTPSELLRVGLALKISNQDSRKEESFASCCFSLKPLVGVVLSSGILLKQLLQGPQFNPKKWICLFILKDTEVQRTLSVGYAFPTGGACKEFSGVLNHVSV